MSQPELKSKPRKDWFFWCSGVAVGWGLHGVLTTLMQALARTGGAR